MWIRSAFKVKVDSVCVYVLYEFEDAANRELQPNEAIVVAGDRTC